MISTFGPGSPSYKKSETAMQIVCGKRAECIEVRRDRILKEIENPNLRLTLQNIPPSQEYLFSREALQPVIASLGGSQMWLNTPSYVREKKSYNIAQSQYRKPHKTHSRDYKTHTKSYKLQNKDYKSQNKQNFKYKSSQPFRKGYSNTNQANKKPS
ncbi:unnamed protein product [Arctia plantaginis]|uniref:Uncharacterized protein n=1 Tax=Arctia plantaginis TaxID=874455 RepID=A0A8S0YNT5_ARCPL|nr:unnamed protein product [Arctia plantaginis]